MFDIDQRLRSACKEYGIRPFTPIAATIVAFRHIPGKQQDKILDAWKSKYPRIYSVLLEVKLNDERNGHVNNEATD